MKLPLFSIGLKLTRTFDGGPGKPAAPMSPFSPFLPLLPKRPALPCNDADRNTLSYLRLLK